MAQNSLTYLSNLTISFHFHCYNFIPNDHCLLSELNWFSFFYSFFITTYFVHYSLMLSIVFFSSMLLKIKFNVCYGSNFLYNILLVLFSYTIPFHVLITPTDVYLFLLLKCFNFGLIST